MAKQFQVDTGGTLTTNLVAYYKLEDVTEFYIGGGTYDFTNEGTATFAAGKVNNGVSLTRASSQRLVLSNNLGIDGGSISFAAWVKTASQPSGVDANGFAAVFQIGNSTQVAYFMEYQNNGGTKQVRFTRLKQGLGVDPRVTVNQTFTDGTWYHMVLTYDGTSKGLKGYVNGSQVGSTATGAGGSGSDTNASKVAIGANYFTVEGVQSHWDGMVDECGIWSKELTTTEITDLYNSGNGQTMTSTSTLANVKTVDGLAIASVSKLQGLATSSIKSWNGVQ